MRRSRSCEHSLEGERRRSESNRRIEVLQTSALPLGYGAGGLENGQNAGRSQPTTHAYCRRWLTAMMFPSLSLNHAVFAPPPVAMLFFILIPGMSYSSNTTPRAFSSATSASTSLTCQYAWLAFDVPALPVGYM